MPRHATLTGRWLGRYDYGDARAPVAFEADLVEEAGALSGRIEEPNSFRPDGGPVLGAEISGSREGRAVAFFKRYDGFSRFACPDYEGLADAALCRIEGRWFFRLDRGQAGRFVMIRKPRAEARAERRVAAEVE